MHQIRWISYSSFILTSPPNNHAHIETVGNEHHAGLKQNDDLGGLRLARISGSTSDGHDGNGTVTELVTAAPL